jgi:hypothetical protein
VATRLDLRETFNPPVFDQGQIGCHDEKTEVLTEKGFVHWSDYETGTPIGTVNQFDGKLEFQLPTALHVHNYHGEMITVERDSMNFLVTPNHRMYVRKWNQRVRTLNSNFEFVEAEKLGWYSGLQAAPTGFVGTQLNSINIGRRKMSGDDFAAFVSVMVSDGYAGGIESANPNRVGFCCFNPERYNSVAALAQRLGFAEQPSRKGVWYDTDPELAAWLRTHIYSAPELGARNKRIPRIVFEMSEKQISNFLGYYGDKHTQQRGVRHFYTSSPNLANDLQELLLRVGKRASFYTRAARSSEFKDGRKIDPQNCVDEIVVCEWKSNRHSIDRKKQLRTEEYHGNVFCATVDNSTIITRRNGQILISGNSCVAQGAAYQFMFARDKMKLPRDWVPSRLFIYWHARARIGSPLYDGGCYIRDAMDVLRKLGAPPESYWPHNATASDPNTWLWKPKDYPARKPNASAHTQAARHQALVYQAVRQDVMTVKACLTEGWPVVFGCTIFNSLYQGVTPKTLFPMPSGYDYPLGGHCMVIVGYDDRAYGGTYIVRNSWGEDVGDKGHFYIPYAYLASEELASDFWTLREIENAIPGVQ